MMLRIAKARKIGKSKMQLMSKLHAKINGIEASNGHCKHSKFMLAIRQKNARERVNKFGQIIDADGLVKNATTAKSNTRSLNDALGLKLSTRSKFRGVETSKSRRVCSTKS